MNTSVSILRGINVGGHHHVSMEELRKCYERLGFWNVRTFIQSGNVLFEHQGNITLSLTAKIENEIKKSLGFDVTVIVRTREDLGKVIENFPFTQKEEDRAHVTFLSTKPAEIPTKEINEAKDASENFLVSGREVYLYCPNGYGRSKLSNSFFERKLKVSATTRNWRTVYALYALAKGRAPY